MPFSHNPTEIASAVCFVLFAVLAFTVSALAGAPALALGVLLGLRARALTRSGAVEHPRER